MTGSVSTTVNNQTATNQSYTPAGSVSITGISGSASATTLATSQLASHTHTENVANNAGGFGGRGPRGENTWGGATASNMDTVAAGGNGSHTHGFSFSSGTASFGGTPATITQNAHNHTFTGAAINLAVQYIDVIRATKD